MGREFELKYRADAGGIAAILEKYGEFTSISMETAYYDTGNADFSRRHWTLRRRYENGLSVCTLKTPAPDGSRGEWECYAETIEDGIRALIVLGAPKLLAGLAVQGVQPCCGARFTRLAAQVSTTDGVAELALDSGVLLGGSAEIPLCEVELELKSGSEAAAVALAHQIAQQYQLTEESKSKFRRAMDLAQGE